MENDQVKEWIADAIAYMYDIGLFTQAEWKDCVDLAESLHYNGRYEDEINPSFSAKDAVDEELTYWGE
ncbi:hypothetical protein 16Q_008c [Pseudomonas phage 16Q]|nr:hypothetical protein 16Q_008c [Pseudomonas phage 16Q]